MALAPLATSADLSARGIDVTDGTRVAALLASASEAVRAAAGDVIGPRVTSHITLAGVDSQWLPIPLYAASKVAAVQVDGVDAGQVSLLDGRLWRSGGWQASGSAPSVVTLDVTHGLSDVPADVVDMVCSLVAGGMAAAAEQYDPKRGMLNERIDDYGVGFATGENEVVNPLELPERTRAWLRSRFGGSVAVTGEFS